MPLMVAMAAIGAIQMAAVIAKPIPKFEKGVDDFEGGLATVSDGAGDELISTPKGLFLAKGEQTLNLPKHSTVFTAEETKRMLSPSASNTDSQDMSIMLIQAELQGLRSDIRNKDEVKVNIDAQGLRVLKGVNGRNQIRLDSLIN